MQHKPLLSLFILIGLASASRAQAQWPEHSVLAVLPPPVATPSDALAAFLFRMETILDQPRPSEADAYTEYLVAVAERMRQITERAPHAESAAERVVIEGVFALFSELIAARAEREMAPVDDVFRAALDEHLSVLRRDARANWERIATITDPSPEARAWVAYAEARLRALDTILGRGAVTTPVEHRRPERRPSSCGADAMESAARRLLREAR